MFKSMRPVVVSMALLASTSVTAFAADPYVPPPVDPTPPPVVYEEPKADYGGWYIRGDVDYHWSKLRSTEYITYGPPAGTAAFTTADLKGTWSVGGGIGYQITNYLRTDLTVDYWAKSDFTGSTTGVCLGVPCVSADSTAYQALLVLANAYVDLGTYHGITPYVGAGIGGAYMMWDDLRNTVGGVTTVHAGASNWRFAWALMAGASYCLTDRLELDVGYRYTRVHGGRMFEFAPIAGPGFDGGLNVHEARAGLRWNLGHHGTRCAPPPPKVVDYIPPVYK